MIPALLTCLLAAATAPQTLPGISAQLAKERAQARQLAGREAGLLGRLADFERQIEVDSKALRAAQARLRASNARFTASETRNQQAQAELDQAVEKLGPRLTARYRLGREGYLRFLLGSRSIADVLRRKRLFNALLEADLDALAVLRFRSEGARAAHEELAAARAELQASVQSETDRRSSLEERVEQQRRLLATVQQEKAVHEQAVRELEESERELRARLADLQTKPPPAGAPAVAPPPMATPEIQLRANVRKARGKLGFPLATGRIEAHFGRTTDPRFGTITLQRGIDVRAPLGTPVFAVWDGKVVHAGWFRGYGNLVIVDHGDGVFSLMAHLDQLERTVGEPVRAGDQVGTVGDTGSLKGAYLYFELRDGQKPLDPERWLLRKRAAPALLAGAKGAAR